MRWLQNVIGTPVEGLRVKSEDQYRAKALAIQKGLGVQPRLVETGKRRPAYVSDGRWVLDCDCGNGCLAHPGDGSKAWPRSVAICTECGNVYTPRFPEERKAVEAALLVRPNPLNRHFFPDKTTARQRGFGRGEVLEDLERENTERGLSARKRRR